MFSLFIMPKMRTFGHFLASSEDKFYFLKKEDMSSKKRTYGKPSGFKLDSSLVDSGSIRVWWTRTRLEHFQMNSDSTRVLQWVDSFQHCRQHKNNTVYKNNIQCN